MKQMKKNKEIAAKKAESDKIKRRATRKRARETREKDLEKEKMRKEITKYMVEKGATL